MTISVTRCRDSGDETCGESGELSVVYRICSEDVKELDPALIIEENLSEWRPNTLYGDDKLFVITIPSSGGPWEDNNGNTVVPGVYKATYVGQQTSGEQFDEPELAKMLTAGSAGAIPGCYDRYKDLDGNRYPYTLKKRSLGELVSGPPDASGNKTYCREVTLTYERITKKASATDPSGEIDVFDTDPLRWCPEVELKSGGVEVGRHKFPFVGFFENPKEGDLGPCPPGANPEWVPNTFYDANFAFTITIPDVPGNIWIDSTGQSYNPGRYTAYYPSAQTSGAQLDEAELLKMVVDVANPPLFNFKDVVHSCARMIRGEITPLQTTAGQPFDPVQKTSRTLDFALTFNRPTWGTSWGCYIDTVNEEPFIISIPCRLGFAWYFDKHTVWLKEILEEEEQETVDSGDFSFDLQYIRTTYLLSFNPVGWFLDLANRGTKRCMFDEGNSHDGFGGDYGYTDPMDPPDAMPLDVGVKDADGVLVNTPIWLDIRGFPERDGDRSYLRYVDSYTSDFNDPQLKLVNWAS